MKRFAKYICLVLSLVMCIVLPVKAEEIAPYGSAYFGSHNAYLWNNTGSSFEVWFSISAVRTMDELGANYIEIERSSDGVNWSVVKTYSKDNYSNLIAHDTIYHSGHVTYTNVQSGYQYQAYVSFYAKDSSGNRGYSGAYAYF